MSSSLIEEVYFQAWGKAGGSGRVRRAFSLFASMLARCSNCRSRAKRRIQRAKSSLGRLRSGVYLSDAAAQQVTSITCETSDHASRAISQKRSSGS